MAGMCVCGHVDSDHQRKRFITDYTAPCNRCGCKDFDEPKEDKETVMDEHLVDVGARALADARGDAEPTSGDRLLAEIVITATTFERPSPLHDFVRDWFVKHLGDKWKGYAHALACDIIEDGFTNEGNRR